MPEHLQYGVFSESWLELSDTRDVEGVIHGWQEACGQKVEEVGVVKLSGGNLGGNLATVHVTGAIAVAVRINRIRVCRLTGAFNCS